MKSILVLIAASMLAGAQDARVQPSSPGAARRPGTPTGPTPKLADGTVDLSGVWRPDINFIEDIALGLKPGASQTGEAKPSQTGEAKQ